MLGFGLVFSVLEMARTSNFDFSALKETYFWDRDASRRAWGRLFSGISFVL